MASKYNLSSNKLGRMMKGYEKPKKEKKGSDKSEKSSSKIQSFDFGAPGKPEEEAPKGKLSGLDELKNLSVVDEQDYKTTSETKDAQVILPPKQWKPKSTLRGFLSFPSKKKKTLFLFLLFFSFFFI
jgi:hypothetical protein